MTETLHGPVQYAGTSMLLNTRLMVVGKPYWLLCRNAKTMAIKRKDGAIELYRVPAWFVRWFGWLI